MEQSTFTQIRTLLSETERDVVAVRHDATKAASVITQVEQAEALLAGLRDQRVDVRAETGRADSLRGRLLRDAALIVRQVEKSGAADQLRGSPLWHEIRDTEIARGKRNRRNMLVGLGSAVLVVVLVFVVLPRVFPAPPTANIMAVDQLVDEGDLEAALARARAEQAQAPNDAQIGLWIAALQQQLNKPEAAASWEAARARYSDETSYLSDRVGVALSIGDLEDAEQAAESLRAAPDGAAIGLYQLASVREAQQRNQEAIQLFQQASDQADKEGRPELVAAARTRMATLMQMP